MTNTNEMNKINLFEKRVATLDEVIAFADSLAKYNLKKSVALDKRYETKDTLIAYTGNTHNGNLVAIWSRVAHKRAQADYGLRISNALLEKLTAKSDAIKILFSNAKYADSNESRISFTSLDDITRFLETLHNYLIATKATKNIELEKSISA